jgi:hypothetical protein
MRRPAILPALAIFLMASTLNVRAGSLAGVSMPDTVQVGGTTLVLNGMGLRTKFMVKVYVAGLYLDQKSSDASAILQADAPKRIVMHFLHGASKSQITNAFDDSFNDNAPDARKVVKDEINQFLGVLEPLKEGDEMVFTYILGMGTICTINGKEKLTIAGKAFGPVLFSVWLGPKPPNAVLKKGILSSH